MRLYSNSDVSCRLLQIGNQNYSTKKLNEKNIYSELYSQSNKHNNNDPDYVFSFNEIEFIVVDLGNKGGCSTKVISKKRVMLRYITVNI